MQPVILYLLESLIACNDCIMPEAMLQAGSKEALGLLIYF